MESGGRNGRGSMRLRSILLEKGSAEDRFRLHVGDYMRAHGWRAGGLYLSMFLLAPVAEIRGIAEACRRLNVGRSSGLSFFKPYAFIFDHWVALESAAVPRECVTVCIAQEIAEIMAEEHRVSLDGDGMYWRETPVEKDAPSRAFALELCLPSPEMAKYRARGFCAGDVALRCGLDKEIVAERMAMEDLSPAEIEIAVKDFQAYVAASAGAGCGVSLEPAESHPMP